MTRPILWARDLWTVATAQVKPCLYSCWEVGMSRRHIGASPALDRRW